MTSRFVDMMSSSFFFLPYRISLVRFSCWSNGRCAFLMRGKMAAKMAEKMKTFQNKSTNIPIYDEIQNILVKNPEAETDL